ncbi:MAG: hypothetical protein JNL01_11795 [Bdellovibrionales bacterium]|nr:hypothetical protein [Bdellovibrionales bacterium]
METSPVTLHTQADPLIQKGSIIIYRVFDVAGEINLVEVERIYRARSGGTRLSIARGGRNSPIMRNAPVRVELGETVFKLGLEQVKADVSVKIFDYGVLSLSYNLAIPPRTSFSQLISRAGLINGDLPGTEELDELAKKHAAEVLNTILAATKNPVMWSTFEDYALYFLESIEGIDKPSKWMKVGKIPELLLGEPIDPISTNSREGILEIANQYSENDLAVIDWNSAVVIEPTGQKDIPDVIEFALTHLLEFRFYDDLLDRRLASLYDAIEEKRNEVLKSSFAKLSRDANSKFLEFSEFLERIDNSLKVVGDFYLAVVFRAALRRFRIKDWQQSLTRKLNLMAQVSQLLQAEVNVYRSHILELIIIALILFEVIQAIAR